MRPLLLMSLCAGLCGCDNSMTRQPKFRTYAPATLWADGASARPLPERTVSRIDLAREAEGKTPPPLNAELLERGQQRYRIFCTPCHGMTGEGDGVVVKRGFSAPTSFANVSKRQEPAQEIYDSIASGYGPMASFGSRIPPRDRWAIVAYVRALQLASGAPLALAPEAAEKLK